MAAAELLRKSRAGSEQSRKWFGFWLISETVKPSYFETSEKTVGLMQPRQACGCQLP